MSHPPDLQNIHEIIQNFKESIRQWLEDSYGFGSAKVERRLEQAIQFLTNPTSLGIIEDQAHQGSVSTVRDGGKVSDTVQFIAEEILEGDGGQEELLQLSTTPLVNLIITQRFQQMIERRKQQHLEEVSWPAVRRLPVEVIGIIVRHALGFEGSRIDPQPATLKTYDGVWVYAQVNRIWRHAVLSHSELWARIQLASEDFKYSPREACRTLLARSKDYPLDMVINMHAGSNSKELKDVLIVALEQAHRWQNVYLGVCSRTIRYFMDELLGTMLKSKPNKPLFPILQSLRIGNRWANTSNFPIEFKLFPREKSFPALQRLSFHDVANVRQFPLPWSQITHLEDKGIVEPTRRQFFSVHDLKTMPNMVRLYAGFIIPPNWTEIIVLDRVTSLRVVIDLESDHTFDPRSFVDLESAVAFLKTPALSEVHVDGHKAVEQVQALRELAQRSECSIETLVLHTASKMEPALSDWFAELSLITTLEVHGMPTPEFTRSLYGHFPCLRIVKLGKAFICPRRWKASEGEHYQEHYDEFLKFLQTRVPGSVKELWFVWKSPLSTAREVSEELLTRAKQRIQDAFGDALPVHFGRTEAWR